MQVFTSSGAGTWEPPLRLGSNPEISRATERPDGRTSSVAILALISLSQANADPLIHKGAMAYFESLC